MLDEKYMRLALNLAKNMAGQTSPNPPVGAVVIKDHETVGIGAHLTSGEAHAEVFALQMAGDKAKDSTIYVTLEPCSHIGQTDPCADLIINKGVKRAVIACMDPNKEVSGKGIEKLLAANIEVTTGILQAEAEEIYREYFHYIQTMRPYVTVKSAVSLDGKTASQTGDSKWITSIEAREDVHLYRHTHDAILVGVGTVLADNPSLTTHLIAGGKNPIRIILDTCLRTPIDAKVVTDEQAETWIFTGNQVLPARKDLFNKKPFVKVIEMPAIELSLTNVLAYIGKEKVTSLFVEGGSNIHGSFLRENLINQLLIYIAPKLIGGEQALGAFGGKGIDKVSDARKLEITHVERIGSDLKIISRNEEE